MKHIHFLLLISLFFSIITPSISAVSPAQVSRLASLKKSLSSSTNEFISCLKGNKDCDPKKVKIVRTVSAIIGILTLITIGGSVYYVYKQRKPSAKITQLTQLIELTKQDTDLLKLAQILPIGGQDQAADLIAQGAQVNARSADERGATPLAYAAFNGNYQLAEELIKKGAAVNLPEKTGWTPLMRAVHQGHEKLVQLLLDNGADVTIENKISGIPGVDRTALDIAKEKAKTNSNYRSILTLLEDPQKNLDSRLINEQNVINVEKLLRQGAHVNAHNTHGETLLHKAASKGNIVLMKLLLDNNADINYQTNIGFTPLDYASQSVKVDAIRLLRKRDAKTKDELQGPEMKEPSPISTSAPVQDPQIILNKKLQQAFLKTEIDTDEIKQLLAQGAEVNIQFDDQSTPLHQAARIGDINLIQRMVIVDQAHINIWDLQNRTPLDYANLYGNTAVSEYLIKHGALTGEQLRKDYAKYGIPF